MIIIIMHYALLFLLGAYCHQAAAFQTTSPSTADSFTCFHSARVSPHAADSEVGIAATTRRSFAEDLLTKGLIGFSLSNLASSPAYASGGATAGGAYLLSGALLTCHYLVCLIARYIEKCFFIPMPTRYCVYTSRNFSIF